MNIFFENLKKLYWDMRGQRRKETSMFYIYVDRLLYLEKKAWLINTQKKW